MPSTGHKCYDAEGICDGIMLATSARVVRILVWNMRLQSVTQCMLLGAKNVLSLVTSSQGQADNKLLLNWHPHAWLGVWLGGWT